ncbi:MAG: hypothetical protein ACOC56_01870 [Atribacterota bacterium]
MKMNNDSRTNEEHFKRKAEIFYQNLWIAHIETQDGTFYNGRILNIFDSYLELHDRVIGRVKILYVDITKFVEYIPKEKEVGE